jgi:glycosyltransferase involved in cell wall biosynthesis
VPYVPSGLLSLKGKGTSREAYGWNFFNEVQRYAHLAVESVRGEECDVIHCHDWMTFPAGVKAKQEFGKPLVVTVHSIEHDRCANMNINEWISNIEWEGMYYADRVITVSNYMKNRIVEYYGVPPEKIEVVHNAVDAGKYRGERLGLGNGEKMVLFLGRVTVQKGPDYFLESAAKVLKHRKDVTFVVVGKGDMLKGMIKRSIDLGISNKVIFTGFAPEITRYYRMADVYVMPSVSEPFGITALEAMASGTPVILSRQSGVSEVIRHCFTSDFWDTDRMANCILGVLEHDCMKRTMSSNGFAEASCINWSSVAEKTMEVYKKTANN